MLVGCTINSVGLVINVDTRGQCYSAGTSADLKRDALMYRALRYA